MGDESIEPSASWRQPAVAVDPPRPAVGDLQHALALTRAFVTILLAEQAGPLTPVQQDLLETIKHHVSRHVGELDHDPTN